MIRIVMIGAGKVGFHLGQQLFSSGYSIQQVFSRSPDKAKKLANVVESDWCNQLKEVTTNADLYVIAVHDDAIEMVAKELSSFLSSDVLVVHTSGATPSQVFQPYFQRYGIFYPLQSFSENKAVDFKEVPFIVDSPNETDLQLLNRLAEKIGSKAYHLDDQQRKVLHVAAVMVNNFTNHLYQIGQDILVTENISFDLLKPLIRETAAKIREGSPEDMQTGPAIRGDQKTVQRHLEYLQVFPEYYEVYKMLTKSINPELP